MSDGLMTKLPLPRIVCDCGGTCVYKQHMDSDDKPWLQCLKCGKEWRGPHIPRAIATQDRELDHTMGAVADISRKGRAMNRDLRDTIEFLLVTALMTLTTVAIIIALCGLLGGP